MKITAKEFHVKLTKIIITLDKVQWFWVCNGSMIEKVKQRFDMAVTEYHLVAYNLDPKYKGINAITSYKIIYC